MNYILIDYDEFSLPSLQNFFTQESEFYLFFDPQQHQSISFSFFESVLQHQKEIFFIEVDLSHLLNTRAHWAFIIGKIIAKDKDAKFKILAKQEKFPFFDYLLPQMDIEWLASSLQKENELEKAPEVPPPAAAAENPAEKVIAVTPEEKEESKKESSAEILPVMPPANEAIASPEEKNPEKIAEKEQPREIAPAIDNQNEENHPLPSPPQESKKERLKKKAIITNEAEFIRFTTNFIFNLFSSRLYLQQITPPELFIDLKNLLITEYFPPEENYALSEHTDNILEKVFSRLEKKGFISITDENIAYHLAPAMIYENFLKLIQDQQPKKYNGIVFIAKTELFFLENNEEHVNKLIEQARNEAHFTIKNKRVIYPTKKQPATTISLVKNEPQPQQQSLQLTGIRVRNNLSAHHPKISLLTPRSERIKKENDLQFRLALQLIKSPNRPKSIKHLRRFLAAKIATDNHGIDLLIKRLFKERYIIVSNGDKITYRTELIRSSHYEKIVHFLQNGSPFKPKEEEALLNSIRSYLGNKISQAECQAIVKQLIDDRYITIENGIAKYQL